MLVRFVEDVTRGQIGAALQPARELSVAVHDRVQGHRPSLLSNVASKRSSNRVHHITRAYLAAAVDWLFAANMSKKEAKAWWGRPAEYSAPIKPAEHVMNGPASDLTIFVFEELRSRPSESRSPKPKPRRKPRNCARSPRARRPPPDC